MSGDTVLHYVQQWLPRSEQFVHGLVSRSRLPAVVVSRQPLVNLDVFPIARPSSLDIVVRNTPARLRRQAVTATLLARSVRHGVGLVHVHFGYRLADVAGLVHRRDIPLVVSLHGHDVAAQGGSWRPALEAALPLADAVVVPSAFLLDLAVAAGADPSAVRVLPAGVDTRRFEPTPLADGPPAALFVGRFVEKKGLDVLLDAWPRVRAAVPDARLRVLGYGPLEDLARAAGDGVAVELEPDHDEVAAAMRAARVVVSPSRTAGDGDVESLLIVNLEAQASGRAVVTTDHGGIPEYVHDGETALVVPENDAGALADALVTVLSDEGLAARLGAAGPAWASRFDVAACAARHDDLYKELLGAGRPSRKATRARGGRAAGSS